MHWKLHEVVLEQCRFRPSTAKPLGDQLGV